MDLLDVIAEEMGCLYLSDLHQLSLSPVQAEKLRSLSETAYSLKAYNDAASYITGNVCHCETIAQAKQMILDCLQK